MTDTPAPSTEESLDKAVIIAASALFDLNRQMSEAGVPRDERRRIVREIIRKSKEEM